MRAGLAASTVTPGRTPPETSRTTPAIDDWAYAAAGIKATSARRMPVRIERTIDNSSWLSIEGQRRASETLDAGNLYLWLGSSNALRLWTMARELQRSNRLRRSQ